MDGFELKERAVPKLTTIQVDGESHATFKRACEAMPQSPSLTRVASSLMRWFAKQSPAAKTALVSGVDRGLEAVYAALLRKLADELDAKASEPDIGEIGKPSPRISEGRQRERRRFADGTRK